MNVALDAAPAQVGAARGPGPLDRIGFWIDRAVGSPSRLIDGSVQTECTRERAT